MSMLKSQLSDLRARIDRIDAQLVELVNQRLRIVEQIGNAKRSAGAHAYSPDRERHILDRISAMNAGPISPEALRAIYREIMSASLALERAPRVALLGPRGSFSHLAARRKFGHSVELETFTTIDACFDAIECSRSELALVPIENSIAGGVGETLDALIERTVNVCGELRLAVHQHLLGNVPLQAIQRVYSKPEVFDQCRKWLLDTGLSSKTSATPSTSRAAELAASEPGSAAIAGELAAELFCLQKIAQFIEDDRSNVTRFIVLGPQTPEPTGCDATLVAFGIGDRAGALVEVLEALRAANVNIIRLQSRPDRRQPWSQSFIMDLDGHASDPRVAAALQEAAKRCNFWKLIGSYPQAREIC